MFSLILFLGPTKEVHSLPWSNPTDFEGVGISENNLIITNISKENFDKFIKKKMTPT